MKKTSKSMYRELCDWRDKGVHLLLEGKESDPGKIVHAHLVAERGAYMRDYITDESSQEITAICFNRVLKREPGQNGLPPASRVHDSTGRYGSFRERHIYGRTAEITENSDRERQEEFRRRRPLRGRESGRFPEKE